MEPVLCEICKKIVSPLDCWCVIDTRQKTRHYECKDTVNCKPKVKPPQPTPAPTSSEPAPFEIEIPDEELPDSYMYTDSVPQWAEAYPRPSFLQRIKQWFTNSPGYTKVKTS
jgi:hypothetical protein